MLAGFFSSYTFFCSSSHIQLRFSLILFTKQLLYFWKQHMLLPEWCSVSEQNNLRLFFLSCIMHWKTNCTVESRGLFIRQVLSLMAPYLWPAERAACPVSPSPTLPWMSQALSGQGATNCNRLPRTLVWHSSNNLDYMFPKHCYLCSVTTSPNSYGLLLLFLNLAVIWVSLQITYWSNCCLWKHVYAHMHAHAPACMRNHY